MWIACKHCEHSASWLSSSTLEVLTLHNTVLKDTLFLLFAHSKTDSQLFYKSVLIKGMFTLLPWNCNLVTQQWPEQGGHWASESSKPWLRQLEVQELRSYLQKGSLGGSAVELAQNIEALKYNGEKWSFQSLIPLDLKSCSATFYLCALGKLLSLFWTFVISFMLSLDTSLLPDAISSERAYLTTLCLSKMVPPVALRPFV